MTHKEHVYLAGSMGGVSESEMRGWRTEAAAFLSEHGIDSLDPTRRGAFHSGEMTPNISRRVFKADLQDIHHSRVVFANLTNRRAKSWGTVAEIAHAHTKNKIIVIVTHPEEPPHPFLEAYATELYHDIEEALRAVLVYYE